MQIELKWYIFLSVAANYNTETQIEMRDGTVEHFPEHRVLLDDAVRGARRSPRDHHRAGAAGHGPHVRRPARNCNHESRVES